MNIAKSNAVVTIAADTGCAIVELRHQVGSKFNKGSVLLVTELMKMHHDITAPFSGRVREIHVKSDQVVEAGDPLVTVQQCDILTSDTVEAPTVKPERKDVTDLAYRLAMLEDDARPDAVAKRRATGQRTARENVDDLMDADSLNEYGALAVAAQRRRLDLDELIKKSPADGIITATGTINADQFGADASRCAVMAVDYTVMAGTQGYFHHQKMDRLLHIAHENTLPIIMFAEGGGGRPNDLDTSELLVAQLNVPSFLMFAKMAGQAPRITIVSGYCFAGNAVFPGMSDVVIATRNSNIGMGGPAMIEGGGLGIFKPEEIGPSDVQSANGVIDILVEDEAEAVAAAKKVLGYFQGAVNAVECNDQNLLCEIIPEKRQTAYSIHQVIETLCDADSITELRSGFGKGMVTVLGRIDGKPFGIFANSPNHLGGAIDADGADKAARFLQLCETFGLPVISLCDTPGFMVGPETEQQAQVRHASRLFLVGANLSVPLFTILTRKGYGLGAMAMAGGSFHQPAFMAAWPSGEIGAMGLEGAVRLGARDKLAAIKDDEERKHAFNALVEELYERGKAINAASVLEFDAVIDPADTRNWILRGLNMVGPIKKSPGRRYVDSW